MDIEVRMGQHITLHSSHWAPRPRWPTTARGYTFLCQPLLQARVVTVSRLTPNYFLICCGLFCLGAIAFAFLLSVFFTNAVLSGITYYLYNEVAFLALSEVAPVTHAVGNTIKRVILILFSVVRFGTPMTQQRSATLPPRAPLAYAYLRFRLSTCSPADHVTDEGRLECAVRESPASHPQRLVELHEHAESSFARHGV